MSAKMSLMNTIKNLKSVLKRWKTLLEEKGNKKTPTLGIETVGNIGLGRSNSCI